MKYLASLTAAAAMTVAATMAPTTAAQAQDNTIQMGVMQWETSIMVSRITKHMLERFGYEVQEVEFQEWGIAHAALVNGDIDILNSSPDYVAHDYWERNRNDLEKLSVGAYGLVQGLVVPSYVPINSIDELNDHVDALGGRIIGVEPGSGLMRQSHNVVEAYGLDFDIIDGSGPAAVAELSSAIDRGDWIVTMYWTPSWVFQAFDIKFLEDPMGVQEPAETYLWIARKGFAVEEPRAREIIASVFIPLEALVQMTGWVQEGASIDESIARWEEANQDRLDRQAVLADE